MKSDKLKRIKKNIISVFTAVLCIAVFVITFANNKHIPDWNDIFRAVKLFPSQDQSVDFVRILDVGQGDSILIYSNGYSALIDTGLTDSSNDIALNLENCGIKNIDALLITHLHMDHVGGLQRITESFNIKNLIIPDLLSNSEGLPAAKHAKETVIKSNGGIYTAVQGMNLNIGEFEITIIAYYPYLAEENDKSIVAVAEIDGVKFLLTGDAEARAENEMLSDNLNLDCDVLKVGHHGSNSSSQKHFLKAVSPEYAVISVGEGNMYSHPHKESIDALDDYAATVYRTDRDGDITFYVDNGKINVSLEKQEQKIR